MGDIERYTERERRIAYDRLDKLTRVAGLRRSDVGVVDALRIAGLSRSQYNRWNKAYKERGIEGLIPLYSARKSGKVKMTEVQQAWMREKMGHPNQPHALTLYNHYYRPFCHTNSETPVSYSTFQRMWLNTPEAYKIKYRSGNRAFDVSGPFHDRDLNGLDFLEMINSDHMQWDSEVRFSKGKTGFPWLTWWMDMGTRMPLGWVVVECPDQDTINKSLYMAIHKYGLREESDHVYMTAYIDNGRDYRSRQFMGIKFDGKVVTKRFKVDIDEVWIRGVYDRLDITAMFTKEYNARSKPAEPAHRTLHNLERADLDNFYRGTGPEHRPEYMKGKIAGGKDIDPSQIPTLEEFAKRVDGYMLDYMHAKHSELGCTPYEACMKKQPLLKYRRYTDEKLAVLMARLWQPKPIKIQANGVLLSRKIDGIIQKWWFYNDKLQKLEGVSVFVKYNPVKYDSGTMPKEVFIYGIKDNFISTAFRMEKVHPYEAAERVFSDMARKKSNRKNIAIEIREEDEAVLKDVQEADLREAKVSIVRRMYNNNMSEMSFE